MKPEDHFVVENMTNKELQAEIDEIKEMGFNRGVRKAPKKRGKKKPEIDVDFLTRLSERMKGEGEK